MNRFRTVSSVIEEALFSRWQEALRLRALSLVRAAARGPKPYCPWYIPAAVPHLGAAFSLQIGFKVFKHVLSKKEFCV